MMYRILVVDDEVKTCDILKRFLDRKGYDFTHTLCPECLIETYGKDIAALKLKPVDDIKGLKNE